MDKKTDEVKDAIKKEQAKAHDDKQAGSEAKKDQAKKKAADDKTVIIKESEIKEYIEKADDA